MSCSVRSVSPSRTVVSVNGCQIPRDVIAREAQHHPSDKPTGAWEAAARALVIRELLLQEANRLVLSAEPLVDDDGRRETDEEASMRTLIEQEVQTPVPDEAACRCYFEQNRQRFRTPNLFEARHILLAAHSRDAERMRKAEELASAIIAELHGDPGRFPDLAALHSDCPSASQGGNLGQLGRGQTVPEFERALATLRTGDITTEPVRTRFGLHIIRVERRIDGRDLPFEAVHQRIAAYLSEAVARRAVAQYVGILAGRAQITGIQLAPATGPLVQ
jgi:peptidyl-prolyl cis-trans isomerase C